MRLMAPSRESTRPADLLVERAKRRDHSAFEDLYWEHHRRVYALMLRMACDPGRAEELTQDVFVQAWKGLPKFRGDSSFGTWLHALAVRTFLNADRRDRRIHDREVSGDALDRYVFAAKQAMPGTSVDLEQALAALPAKARQVVLLHDVYGYKHAEIADLLGIAEGTAKAQLHRARKLMREVLKA